MSGWNRVAVGLQKVAQAAAHQTTEQVSLVVSRSALHGGQMASKAVGVSVQDTISNSIATAESIFVQGGSVRSTGINGSTSTNAVLDDSSRLASENTIRIPKQDSNDPSPIGKTPSEQKEDMTTTLAKDEVLDEPQVETSRQLPSSAEQEETTVQHIAEGRAVPSTRVGRAAGFASLGARLLWGTATEGVSRLFLSGGTNNSNSSGSGSGSVVVNDANADRLAASLCRMRGAALKLGQMLSIQDESLLPPALARALEQVRKGAEAMPKHQFEAQMLDQLGPNWRDKFDRFDDLPFAAASIGQVHRATFKGKPVVVKVQYPGVADSIESDLRNMSMLVQFSGMAPRGLFLENVLRVGQAELKVECDYRRELRHQRRLRDLVAADPFLSSAENRFVVPDVVEEVSSDRILTSEYRPGGTIDKVANMDQEERNRIGKAILYLTFQEIFAWRFMQTDPNWGNFLYDVGTRTTSLIDFGATRDYSKDFVDGYLRIVWASANRDRDTLLEQSRRMKFLTGQEHDDMINAHVQSGFTVGEPFWKDEPFDFRGSNISSRMSGHMSVFLKHRLTAPPEEVYTLHRKIAGAYMLCIKLGAIVQCRDILETIVSEYSFDDSMEPPHM